MQSVLLALCAAWAGARVCGDLCARFGQPRVVGEILAGVLLGPTGLGADASAALFSPVTVVPSLQSIASLGLTLYIFSVGLDFDVRCLAPVLRQVVVLALLSTALPAGAAALVALGLPAGSGFVSAGASALSFNLALASAFACSALPVAALILQELGMFTSLAGRTCIGAGAVITVLQFVLLKLADAAATDPEPAAMAAAVGTAVGGTAALTAGLGIAGRLWAAWRGPPGSRLRVRLGWPAEAASIGPSTYICTYAVALLSGIATDQLGFTVVLGGFFAGCAAPFDADLRSQLKAPFATINGWLLLPIFFVVSGLATDLRLIQGEELPGILLIIGAAIFSKLAVALVAAPLTRQPLRTAGVLCAMLNCRGLLVLVINLKADALGLFGDGTKGALVLMAIISTAMTGPLVHLLADKAPRTAPADAPMSVIAEGAAPMDAAPDPDGPALPDAGKPAPAVTLRRPLLDGQDAGAV